MSYFEERNIELYLKNEQTVAQYYYKLEKAFIRSKNEIQRTIESFYGRYAKENGLSYYESQMAINSAEIMELREFIEHSLTNIDNKYSKSLELASLRHRISRYEALQMQIDAMLTSLYSKDYEEASIDKLKHIYTNTYEMGRFNIDKFRGYGKAFSTIDENSLVKLIQYPFNGVSFSSRIWKQKEHLQGVVMESLTTMLVQGSHPSKLSKELADKFKTKRFDAYRLLHTESSYLTNRATIDSYIDDGVKKFQILATLDSKTCSICGSKDNKIIELKESLAEDEKNIVGLDLPPFHPLCRCTTVPYDDEFIEDSETRVARDENGEYIDVPASMGYGEWREKFVEKEKERETDLSRKTNNSAKEIKEHTIDVPNLKEDEKNSIIEYKEANQETEKELKKRSTEFWDSMLDSEKEAIQKYSGPYYRDINKYLRGVPDITKDTEKIIKMIEEIDRALSRNTLGDDLILYRGVSLEEFESWKNINTINTYKSTSISREVADDFNSDYKILIKAHKDTKGFYLGDYSEYKSEKEFLLHRNQKYKILNMTDNELEVEFYDR